MSALKCGDIQNFFSKQNVRFWLVYSLLEMIANFLMITININDKTIKKTMKIKKILLLLPISIAAGANAVKNLLKVGFFHTFDNVNAAVEHKKHKIASYLIQAAQEHQFALQQAKEEEKHKQQMKLAAANIGGIGGPLPVSVGGPVLGSVAGAIAGVAQGLAQQTIPLTGQALQHPLIPKPLHALLPLKQKLAQNVVQHLSKHLKKPIKKPHIAPPWIVYSKTRTLPTTTISEGYIHTFDNKLMPPNFEGPRERNPYADMGVTSYKHFEDTILKELEEKEERKVEATMHTLIDDEFVVHDSLEGTKPGFSQEWQPFNAHENGLFTSGTKPVGITQSFTQSSFDRPFNDVRPVCEHLDEAAVPPTLFVFPSSAESSLNELQEATNQNSVSVQLNDKANSTSNSTTTEKPNYPAYFIKQQQELRKLQQRLVGSNRTRSNFGNKTTQRGKPMAYGRRTPQSSSTLPTTTTTTPTTPSTTTTDMPVYFFSMNGTDDGFRPMLPSEIKAMKIKKPIRIKPNGTSSFTPTSTARPRSSIQAQASHLQFSVVAAPDAHSKRAKSLNKNSYVRNAPKKNKPTVSSTVGNTNATTKSNQKSFRGSVKFSDSLHQSQTS